MIHLYIFNDLWGFAAQYGIGTYLIELSKCIRRRIDKISIVNLNASGSFNVQYQDDIRYISIPRMEKWSVENNELYCKNVFYLLKGYVSLHEDAIFHFNFIHHLNLALHLKKNYVGCRFLLVIHALKSLNTTIENVLLNRNGLRCDLNPQEVLGAFEEEKNFMEIVDKVVCLCHYTKRRVVEDYKIDCTKVSLVCNFLEDRFLGRSEEERTMLKTKYGISNHEKLLLYVGRIDRSKGIFDFSKTLRLLCRYMNSSVKLMIAGSGLYEQLLSTYGDLCTNVILMGKVSPKEIDDLCKIADIGILPSYIEQCSYTAIEMFMNFLPLIGVYSIGLSDMFERNDIGRYCVEFDSKNCEYSANSMSEIILSVLNEQEKHTLLQKKGREKFELYYSSKNRNVLGELYDIESYNRMFN